MEVAASAEELLPPPVNRDEPTEESSMESERGPNREDFLEKTHPQAMNDSLPQKRLSHEGATVASEADTSCTLSFSSSFHSDSEDDERQKGSAEIKQLNRDDDPYTRERSCRLLTDIIDLEICRITPKKVQFDEECNRVHCDPHTMTNREKSAYWYTSMDLQSFQIDRQVMARNTLKSNKKTGLMAFMTTMISAPSHQQSAQEQLEAIYSRCSSFTSDEMIESMDITEIRNLYQRTQELPGLEHLCITPIRGSSSSFVRAILQEYVYLQDFDNEEHDALAHISESTTRSSRILAHVLAAAQACAL